MAINKMARIALLGATTLLFTSTADAHPGRTLCFTTATLQAAGPNGPLDAFWWRINDRGQIAGFAVMPDGTVQGAVYDPWTRRTTFVVVDDSPNTQLFAINNRGLVGGAYIENGLGRPFLYDLRTGVVTKPNLADPTTPYQEVTSLNDRGHIGAFYIDVNTGAPVSFVAKKRSGAYVYDIVPLPFPGGINDINNRGDVVGNYADNAGVWHGFLITAVGRPNARLTQLDEPGATNTFVFGINDFRWIVGFSDAQLALTGKEIGFVHRFSRGDYFPVDDAASTAFTLVAGVNNWGRIVGAADAAVGFKGRPTFRNCP